MNFKTEPEISRKIPNCSRRLPIPWSKHPHFTDEETGGTERLIHQTQDYVASDRTPAKPSCFRAGTLTTRPYCTGHMCTGHMRAQSDRGGRASSLAQLPAEGLPCAWLQTPAAVAHVGHHSSTLCPSVPFPFLKFKYKGQSHLSPFRAVSASPSWDFLGAVKLLNGDSV